MITFFIFLVFGLFVGVLGYCLMHLSNCNKTFCASLISLGIIISFISSAGLFVSAGYQSCLNDIKAEQERTELIEKQKSIIEELGLTDEQLDLLRQMR